MADFETIHYIKTSKNGDYIKISAGNYAEIEEFIVRIISAAVRKNESLFDKKKIKYPEIYGAIEPAVRKELRNCLKNAAEPMKKALRRMLAGQGNPLREIFIKKLSKEISINIYGGFYTRDYFPVYGEFMDDVLNLLKDAAPKYSGRFIFSANNGKKKSGLLKIKAALKGADLTASGGAKTALRETGEAVKKKLSRARRKLLPPAARKKVLLEILEWGGKFLVKTAR